MIYVKASGSAATTERIKIRIVPVPRRWGRRCLRETAGPEAGGAAHSHIRPLLGGMHRSAINGGRGKRGRRDTCQRRLVGIVGRR